MLALSRRHQRSNKTRTYFGMPVFAQSGTQSGTVSVWEPQALDARPAAGRGE